VRIVCVILICKTRGLTRKEVATSFTANDDGVGVAWYANKQISYRKGFMRVQHFMDFYFDEHIDRKFPHVVHFRNASNSVTQKLTHPFVISEKSPLKLTYHGKESLLFHNGVVSNWKKLLLDFYIHNVKKIPDGEWSDSRFAAILTHFMGPNILSILGDKFVLFSTTNINLYGEFTDDDEGLVASNMSYKTGRTVLTQTQLRSGMTATRNPMEISSVDDIPDIYGDE
jgi:hypothetical protein